MAKATVCIPRKAVQDLIRRLGTAKELDTMDPDTRVDIWKITDEQVDQVLESRNLGAVAKSVTSKPISGKIKGNLKYTKFKSQADAFIQKLRPKEGMAGNLRDSAIALETIFETIKGHSDIARSEGLELGPLSFNNGTPNVPLHSMAAAIGRKILHRHGYTANTNKGELAPVEVEAIVYSAGMRAIKVLADNGLVELHADGVKAIDRSLEDINDSVSFNPKDFIRTDNPAVSLNLAAFHLNPTSKKESDSSALKYFTDRSASDVSKHPLSAINQVLDVVNALSQPAYIRFPTKTKAAAEHDMDVYELDPKAQAGRESVGSKPLFIDEDLHTFFDMLSKATARSGKSATAKVRDLLVSNPHLMQSLFKIDTNNEVVSQRSNVKGRNQSNAVPLDDLVEYFEYFGNANQELFFDMFMGRNGRGYLDTSILNYHQSKAMRHTLTVKPYTMEHGSVEHKYYINKVAVRLDVSPEHVLGTAANDQQLTDLNDALQGLDRFLMAEDLADKMKAMTHMRDANPGLDFADLVTTLKAVRGVRDSIGKPLTTTYAVSSDATASGGLITLFQALGTVPAVEKLLKSMGVLSKDVKQIPDVYELLKKRLEFYVKGEKDPEGMKLPQSKGSPGQTELVTKLVHEVLNKGDTRKMSKGPTMTFIYGQSKPGAERTLAKEFTESTLALLKARDKKSLDVINAVMETAYTKEDIDTLIKDNKLANDLIGSFVQTGSPGLMYDMLKITVMEKYLSVYKEREKRVFTLLEQYPAMNKLKSLPASAAVEFGAPESVAQLEKHGVPLQKEYEVRHTEFGTPLITRENKLRETVIGVSQVHTADTAAMFRSLDGLPQSHDSGVMTVHDDARGSAPMIMEFDNNYKTETLNVAMNYDIHEQVLLAAALYDPKIKQDPDYVALMEEITEQKAAKQEALKNFNNETDSIIGDELADFDIPGKPTPQADRTTSGTATETEATASVEGERSTTVEDAPTGTATERLQAVAGDSEIIAQFLESSNQAEVEVEGTVAKFDPKTDKISLPEGVSRKDAVELAEHEIVHSYTAAVVQNYYQNGGIKGLDGFERQSDRDIAYVEKALKKLQSLPGRAFRNMDPETAYRIGQITNQDQATSVAELISVLSTEPKTAAEIYKVLNQGGKGTLAKIVERLVARVREVLREVTSKDLESADLDINLLYSSVNGAINAGMTMREAEFKRVLDLQKGFGDLYHTDPKKETGDRFEAHRYQDALNAVVARRLNDPTIAGGVKLVRKTNELLALHFPAYKTAMDKIGGVYDSSSQLQQLMHTVTNANINKKTKNEILSASAKVGTEKTEVTSVELQKFGAETAKLSKPQKKAFYDFTHRMPLHDYFMLADGVDVDQGIEEAMVHLSKDQVDALNDMVDMRVNEKFAHGVKYSVSQITDPNSPTGEAARKYVALKSIKEIGIDEWADFQANEGLYNLTQDAVLANASLNANQENRLLSDMLIQEEPKNPADVRAVKAEDMHKYSFEEKGGWKIAQEPKGNKPGIVYRRVIDQTYNEGAFTDAKYHSSDVDVGPEFRGMENVVQTPHGYKLIVPTKLKEEIDGGSLNDAEQGLVRSLTHAMALQDSQNIRDRLLQNDTWLEVDGQKDAKRLETMIADKDVDHPWFLGGKVPYNELPQSVQDKYMPTFKKLSDVDGFNDKIEYVRKDIAQWLTGDREPSLFNDPKLQWATRITKGLVAGAKIGMVILNPMKIAGDNVSNIAYLSVRGVDPLYIQKQYREISKQFHDYQQMKNRLNHLRVKGLAAKSDAGVKKQVAKLEKQLKEHPANGLVDRGFINSLGSNLVMRASDPSSGMKSDIDTVLKGIFESKDGDVNKLGQTIMKLANWNIGIEEFLEMLSKVPGSMDATKNAEMELKSIAGRMRDIKTQDDVVSYMHQYLNSPDSEFVKLGTYMTDLTDVLSKETLYRYLIDRGMSPKDAEIDVIDSFPDYKENLPTRVKQLSDVGILMFPSYWLRIQKSIYRMIKDKPVNFGTEMSIEAAMGTDVAQIWDANIWKKATGNYGLTHTPWEHMGFNSLFPTNVL